jgi:hypothetical protein
MQACKGLMPFDRLLLHDAEMLKIIYLSLLQGCKSSQLVLIGFATPDL